MKVPLLDLRAQIQAVESELRAAVEGVIASGIFILGPEAVALESEIAVLSGAAHGVGVSNGSDALVAALLALEVGPGDEVIVPTFTFFATAGSVSRIGAKPVFVDVQPDTFNIDPDAIAAAVTPRTRAIIPVHLYGQCADMAPILEIARGHGLGVIEDAAQAIGARDSDGRAAGCLGTVACFSFYPSKNLGAAGDGGMLTTSDGELAHTMRIMRNHGMEPAYHHGILGGNFRLDGIQGAVLSIKLRHLDAWAEGRRKNACEYHERFAERGLDTVLRLPVAREGVYHVFNQYVVRVPDGKRDALMAHLRKNDVGCAIYYPSGCHTQPCVADQGYHAGDFPETERAARETVSLPIFSELSDEQKETVVDVVAEFFGK